MNPEVAYDLIQEGHFPAGQYLYSCNQFFNLISCDDSIDGNAVCFHMRKGNAIYLLLHPPGFRQQMK